MSNVYFLHFFWTGDQMQTASSDSSLVMPWTSCIPNTHSAMILCYRPLSLCEVRTYTPT